MIQPTPDYAVSLFVNRFDCEDRLRSMNAGDSFVTSADQREIVRRAERAARCRVLMSRKGDFLTVVLRVPGVGDPVENALTAALREWATLTNLAEWSGFACDMYSQAFSPLGSLPSSLVKCVASVKDSRELGNILCAIHRRRRFLSVVDRNGKNYYFINFDEIRNPSGPEMQV